MLRYLESKYISRGFIAVNYWNDSKWWICLCNDIRKLFRPQVYYVNWIAEYFVQNAKLEFA